MHIAFANYSQMAHYVYGSLAQEVIFGVGEGLRGGYHYALASVDSEGIEILHIAHGDAVVVAVADYFVFYLFPALQRLLHQHLGGEGEGLGRDSVQLGLIVAETGSQAAQGVCGAHDYGISELVRGGFGFFPAGCCVGAYGAYVDFVEALDKELAVLGVDDGLHRRPQHLDAIALQHSAAVEFDSAVEGGLAAERKEYALRAFFLYDFFDEGGGDRQEVYLVGNAFRGLYGGYVGVDEDRGQSLLAQGLQGLRAAVIEFPGFSYLESAGTEDEDFFQFFVFHNAEMNSSKRNSVSVGPLDASGWN